MSTAAPILVFDSGVGGLSVLKAIRARMPEADFLYVADDAAFPYGDWESDALCNHILALVGRLIAQHGPAAVVIACNTASTLVLPPLRCAHSHIPFVGTVPAIKPAAERTQSGLISVLATPGTIERDYTRALIDTYASHIAVKLVGARGLAALAEAALHGNSVSDEAVVAEIRPAFVECADRRTDHIVLGCTHYPLLRSTYQRLAPWPVTWIDPAPAIAEQVARVACCQREGVGRVRAICTTGIAISTDMIERVAPAAIA